MKSLFFLILLLAAPRIGITPTGMKDGAPVASSTYITAIEKAGGEPVVLPYVSAGEQAAEALAGVDALLLTGGEDVDPMFYGEEVNGARKINLPRDISEIFFCARALKAGMPVMGICRGSQLLNVVLGGTLVQDIPSEVPSALQHRQKGNGSVATQTALVEPGSGLSKVLGGVSEIRINSLHHQSVETPAPTIRISARTSDGVVEAFEGVDGVKVAAVQFHPEKFISEGDLFFLPLFTEFIKAASTK